MPGVVECREIAPGKFIGAAEAHIGPFTCNFRGRINVTLVDHKAYQVNITGGAADNSLGANFTAKAFTRTIPAGLNRTRIILEVHVGFGGVLGKFGTFVLKPKARQVVEDYARAVAQEIARRRVQLALQPGPVKKAAVS